MLAVLWARTSRPSGGTSTASTPIFSSSGAALTAASAAAPEVNVLAGRVASGDQFVCHESTRRRIVEQFGALCCEMEGAAIAQAAEANGVPFAIVRAISDKPGTEGQAMDYATFERASAERCAKIVEHMVAAL